MTTTFRNLIILERQDSNIEIRNQAFWYDLTRIETFKTDRKLGFVRNKVKK